MYPAPALPRVLFTLRTRHALTIIGRCWGRGLAFHPQQRL